MSRRRLRVLRALGLGATKAMRANLESDRVVRDQERQRRRIEKIAAREDQRESCNHEWLYHERHSGEDYTGYCEHCPKCGELRQIAQ